MTSTRDRIDDRIRADPGIHVNALVRELDLAPGQVQYHLRRLDVVGESRFGRTHYYPPDYDAWERAALALLRRETAAEIVAVLLADGPLTASETADRIGIADSTLSWHRGRLAEAGLLATDEGRLVVPEPERTAALLDRAEPSVPERLVDRFTRLVDDLLD